MMDFMRVASRPVTNVQTYIEESGGSPLKFSPASGEVVRLYFPFMPVLEQGADGMVPTGEKGLMAYSLFTHDIKASANTYGLYPCLKLSQPNIDANGNVINSGDCPFCRREEDAKKIVEYRLGLEVNKLMAQGLSGEALEKRKSTLLTELNSDKKISYAKRKLYVLVAKFVLDSKNNMEIDKDTGLPAYQLQVMRCSNKQIEDMQKAFSQLSVATNQPVSMAGGEMVITYGDSNDKRHVVGDAQFSAVPPQSQVTAMNKELMDAIQADVANFNWDDIVKPYPEFKGISDREAEKICDGALKLWDNYQNELATNPNAVYAEYGIGQTTFPPLGGTPQAQQLPPQGMQGALPNFQMPTGAPNFGQQTANGFAPAGAEVPNFNGSMEQAAPAPTPGNANSFGAPQQGVPGAPTGAPTGAGVPWGNPGWNGGVQ